MKKREMYLNIWKELSPHKSMIFLMGPRQCGKTTLAKGIAAGFPNRIYFNWDWEAHRKLLMENSAFFERMDRKDASHPLVVLDEIHKFRRWKNYLKGVYDQFSDRYRFLVLGSGRLNVFQKGGDSLAGRYFLFTLWPFTLAELAGQRRLWKEFSRNPLGLSDGNLTEKIWKQLASLSGFPEPYLSGKKAIYQQWSRNYRQQLIREDIRNMTEIKNIDDVEMLFSLLPSKVGSPLSMESLAGDLQVSFNSVRNWLGVLEAFFLVFRISPWSKKISRAITKEKKLYLYDYARIPSPPAKYENMVALELLRAVSNWNDLGRGDFALHYVRNKEREEVDFLLTNNSAPMLLIETKFSDAAIPKSLFKFQTMLDVPSVQLVNQPGVYKILSNPSRKREVLVISASRWLAGLP
ncbi:MAG: ATP-binding protein [Candidatus Omnitrophica bacterium]|nr:ATP-binding protein [Candidatus Omnitrophota bacterium]